MRILFFTQDLSKPIPTSEFFVSVDYYHNLPAEFDSSNCWQYVYRDQKIQPALDSKPAHKDVVSYNREHYTQLLNQKLLNQNHTKDLITVVCGLLAQHMPNQPNITSLLSTQAFPNSSLKLIKLIADYERIYGMIAVANNGDQFLAIKRELDSL